MGPFDEPQTANMKYVYSGGEKIYLMKCPIKPYMKKIPGDIETFQPTAKAEEEDETLEELLKEVKGLELCPFHLKTWRLKYKLDPQEVRKKISKLKKQNLQKVN